MRNSWVEEGKAMTRWQKFKLMIHIAPMIVRGFVMGVKMRFRKWKKEKEA